VTDVSFEFNVPVFAGAPDEGTEPVHRDTPCYDALDWETTKMGVETAEELGFDAVWAPDHLMLGRDHAEYETWTLLSAIAGFTSDVNVGSLVLCNDYRNPALVAKMAATLDVISEGRLELGMGAGWHEPEYDAYGWEYRDGFERLMRLDESIRLMKRLWADDGTGDGVTFDGDHYQTDGAYCTPGPVQDPHPEILVGGQGEEVTLKLVAKHADVWNTDVFNGDLPTLEHKIGVIEDHCETVDRDPDDVEYSWDGHVICTRDEDRYERLVDLMTPIQFEEEYVDQADITRENADEYFVVGEPEECAAAIEERIGAGVTKFQCWFVDFPDTGGMELFADEVVPEFA
jgi:alkanesulfonate monooxygenase SsuD/methylene tetrahydromethanopterin reductase-like flavin-dependent oxidoreductase (luciferase family)